MNNKTIYKTTNPPQLLPSNYFESISNPNELFENNNYYIFKAEIVPSLNNLKEILKSNDPSYILICNRPNESIFSTQPRNKTKNLKFVYDKISVGIDVPVEYALHDTQSLVVDKFPQLQGKLLKFILKGKRIDNVQAQDISELDQISVSDIKSKDLQLSKYKIYFEGQNYEMEFQTNSTVDSVFSEIRKCIKKLENVPKFTLSHNEKILQSNDIVGAINTNVHPICIEDPTIIFRLLMEDYPITCKFGSTFKDIPKLLIEKYPSKFKYHQIKFYLSQTEIPLETSVDKYNGLTVDLSLPDRNTVVNFIYSSNPSNLTLVKGLKVAMSDKWSDVKNKLCEELRVSPSKIALSEVDDNQLVGEKLDEMGQPSEIAIKVFIKSDSEPQTPPVENISPISSPKSNPNSSSLTATERGIIDMGFTLEQARAAISVVGNDISRAVSYIFDNADKIARGQKPEASPPPSHSSSMTVNQTKVEEISQKFQAAVDSSVNGEDLKQMTEMGLPYEQSKYALFIGNNNIGTAVDLITTPKRNRYSIEILYSLCRNAFQKSKDPGIFTDCKPYLRPLWPDLADGITPNEQENLRSMAIKEGYIRN